MTNMDIQSILKQTEELTLDEDKLSLLSDFIGNHFNDLTSKDFIQLLIPLVDITQRIWEQNPVLDTLSDYTIALTKLAENYIKEEQGWLAAEERLLEAGKEVVEIGEYPVQGVGVGIPP